MSLHRCEQNGANGPFSQSPVFLQFGHRTFGSGFIATFNNFQQVFGCGKGQLTGGTFKIFPKGLQLILLDMLALKPLIYFLLYGHCSLSMAIE
jgi:hypothetical protein